jgi:hypothetical protein
VAGATSPRLKPGGYLCRSLNLKAAGRLCGYVAVVIASCERRLRSIGAFQWLPAAALIAVGLLANLAQPATVTARPLITGISYVGTNDPVAFERTRDGGARLVHTWLNWASVAPTQEPANWRPSDPADPNYRWEYFDHWVSNAMRAGLEPLLQIHVVPGWAQRCDSAISFSYSVCDADPERLGAFTEAAVRRYSGYFGELPRVRFWQGLNEPNLSLFFNPQFFRGGKPASPRLYRRLINTFSSAVKSVHSSNVVLAAGLGPIARPHSTIGPMRFARELLCMRGRRNPKPTRSSCEGGVHFDIFDIHPYTTGGPTHKGKVDDVQLGDLAKLQELIAAADRAGRIKGRFKRTPLWITEFSWDSKPPDPGGVPMRILRRWTAEALYQAWRAGVTRFFWFSLRDSARNPKVPFNESLESGLYFRGDAIEEDRPKPHMYAFRFPFVAYSRKDGFSFWGRTPISRGGLVRIQIRKGGNWRTATVARADRHGIFEGEVEGFYGRKKRGWVRARYRKEIAVPFSLKPVRDFWQPPFGRPVE